MKKPSIFLLFAVSVLLPFPAFPAADFPLSVTGEEADALRPQLRAVYLRLARLFRLTPRRAAATLEIALSPAVPANAPEYRVLDAERRLIVCNPADGFFSLPASARRRIYGAMLLTLLPDHEKTPPDFLPGWLSLGIDQMLASRESSERWVRGNRLLPVLRGVAGSGKNPPFAALEKLAADPDEPGAAAAEWIGEMARCRIELMEKEFFQPHALEAFVRKRGGIPGNFTEKELAEKLRRLAWNDLQPRPSELARAALKPLEEVEYPETDADGKPTGKTLRCRLPLLGEALREHPQREAILSRAADGYIRASRGDAREVRRAAERVARAVRMLRSGGGASEREISAALDDLERRLARQRELEELLRREAERRASLADDFRFRFRTVRRPAARLAAPEVEEFLTEFARGEAR